jgi:cell wall-associated NlpC family hydrolase
MQLLWKITISSVLTVVSVCGTLAQDDPDDADTSNAVLQSIADKTRNNSGDYWLTADDRISLLAAALDGRVLREAEPDCSHLVHEIYEAAGFPYPYTPSSDLYAGVEHFLRVDTPRPGDLVVWRGHVGMVINPSHHIFFSYLSSGPGTDDYETAYWRHRGRPRFYRYVKKQFARR